MSVKRELANLFRAAMKSDGFAQSAFVDRLAAVWDDLLAEDARDRVAAGADPDLAAAVGRPLLELRAYTGDDLDGESWDLVVRLTPAAGGPWVVAGGAWERRADGRFAWACPAAARLMPPAADGFADDDADDLLHLLIDLAGVARSAAAPRRAAS